MFECTDVKNRIFFCCLLVSVSQNVITTPFSEPSDYITVIYSSTKCNRTAAALSWGSQVLSRLHSLDSCIALHVSSTVSEIAFDIIDRR